MSRISLQIMGLFFFLISCSGGKGTEESVQTETSAAPTEEQALTYDPATFASPLEAYLGLKDALVASDTKLASAAAARLAELAEGQEVASAKAIAGTENIDQQREAFQTLSEMMYEKLVTEGADVTVYKQFCPMAFDNQGGYWLSSEEEILNPYFGQSMLKCGRVDETLAAK